MTTTAPGSQNNSNPSLGDYFCYTNKPSNFWYRILFGLTTWGTSSTVVHSGVYVGTSFGHSTPQIIEARPGGVGFADYEKYKDAIWSSGYLTLTEEQRQGILVFLGQCVGMKYSVSALIPAAFAQKRLGHLISPYKPLSEQPLWVRKLIRENRYFCSAMVALAYEYAEATIINGYLPWLVSSGDLMKVLGGNSENYLDEGQ